MNKKLFLPTLEARLIFWVTAICLVPLTLMTTVIYFQRVKVAKQLLFDKLSAVSSLRQEQINASLDNLAIVTSTLASDHSVYQAASTLLQKGRPAGPGEGAEALVLFRGYLNSYETASAASVVANGGNVLLSTSDGRRGVSIAKAGFVATAVRDQIPTYGEVYLSEIDGTPSLDVAAPIKGAGGTVPAAVVVHYNLRKLLFTIMENRTGMGETGESLLVNRDAVALTDLHGIPGAVLSAKLKGRSAQLAAQGQSGIAETTDYRCEKVLASYAHLPRTGWGLVCKQDAREVFAPLTSLLWVTYGLASLVSLLVCIFTFRLARSISQPIRDFSRAAAEIGAGDYAARIVPEGTVELRTLASSFNSMAEILQIKMDAQQGVARISESLVTAEDLKGFFDTVLPVFMQVTGARMAVAFMEDPEGAYFVPVQGIGADLTQMRRFDRKSLEGELGIILSAGSVSRFRAADPDNGLRFVTSFGEVLPAEIVTIPIEVDDEIRAFVSLASENPFSAKAQEALDHVRVLLSTCFARVLAGEDIRRLAEELATKNAELTQQSDELVQQSTELALQSDELSRRNRELDQQKQQLEQATRLKSEFLSNMSHELRTPLNSVLALSRVLAVHGAKRLTDEERSYLDIIERNGRHLLALINDILDLAKIESGRQDLYYEETSLPGIAAEVVDGLAVIAREKGIELSLVPEGSLPPVVIDVKRLRQILQNLIGNAVKFTSEGSVIVRLRAENAHLVVDVEDTGIGIAPEHQDMIFQEFRQADGSTSRTFEGTGLGLAIVKKTARLLGGDVTVKSEPGQGSTFSLRLPLDCALPGGSSRPLLPPVRCAKPSSKPPEPDRCVLIVDDDPEAASLIAAHLSRAGYRTVSATSGTEAVWLARASTPFAITLDLMMPDMDGFEVMRELKRHPETAEVPVIMVSLSKDHETGIAMGAIGIINKPVTREQLLEQVEQLAGAGCRLVLVVDENEQDRFSIASLCKENGMDVLLAESGRQALELAVTDRPDLITLDLVRPGLDGAQVLDQLRGCHGTAAIPVVVITSKDLTKEELARLSCGGSEQLSKCGQQRGVVLDELVESLGRLDADRAHPGARKCSRILIVEDSEAATIQLRFALESAGFSVDAVSGGRHAMSYLKTHLPDGIILDLMMPEVDGFGVLQAVRSSALTENVPVMVMTAKTLSPGEHDRLRELNVSHLVQKGDVDLQDLLRRVYEMLGVVRLFKAGEGRPAVGAAPVSSPWQGDGSLLVVEDNPDNLATLRAVLGRKYRIVEAVDGEAGLDAVRSGAPSLILLDMQLPRMDGMTVLKRLKEDPATAAIPVLALTASAMSGDREKLLRAGCAEYLSKPYQIEDLLEMVQRFVAQEESA